MTGGRKPLKFPRMAISSRLVFDCSWEVYQSLKADAEGIPLIDPTKAPSDHAWRPHNQANGADYMADFVNACKRGRLGPSNAPRLILCKLFYIGLVPYERARNFMGIREDVWSDWTDDIRNRVGTVLLHKGLFPPRVYFSERSRPRERRTSEEAITEMRTW